MVCLTEIGVGMPLRILRSTSSDLSGRSPRALSSLPTVSGSRVVFLTGPDFCAVIIEIVKYK
jgi:hypothetical protein